MIQKILLSIILLFVSINPVPVDQVEQSQTKLAPVGEYFNLLEKVGYDMSDIHIEFNDETIPYFEYKNNTYVLISTGVDMELGEYSLNISNKDDVLFSKDIEVVEYDYPKINQGIAYKPASLSRSELVEIQNKKESLRDALEIDRRETKKIWDTSFQYPLKEVFITSDFGRKRIYTNFETQHKGTDFRAAVGTSVYPMSEGRVLWKTDEPLYFEGNALIVDHGQKIVSIYLHLDEILVEEGEFVESDQVIARTGNTGLSTGPHLHLDMRIGSQRIDPVDVIEEFKGISS